MGSKLIKDIEFEEWHKYEDDLLVGFKFADGSKISILDRETGFGVGIRDVETGFRDKDNKFWLASGRFDIRDFPNLTINEAVQKIKEMSNTCTGS